MNPIYTTRKVKIDLSKLKRRSSGIYVVFAFLLCAFVSMAVIVLHNTITIEDIEPYSELDVDNVVIPVTTSNTYLSYYTTCTTTYDTYRTYITTCTNTTVCTTTTESDDIIVITDYSIIVIPNETTNMNPETITNTTISTKCSTTSTSYAYIKNSDDIRTSANFVKTFTRGTYYPGWEGYGSTQVYGGSGRLLMDCGIKDDEIKGSVSCKYIQERYGYNYNGARTIVYLDIPEMPELSGFYYVDDSCLRDDTIDFYFTYKANCPFMNQGVLTSISCYIVPNGSVD